jgi:CRISPR-associated protein Csm4
MTTYRVILQVRSRLATPLAADTLWGHLAWGLRWRDGEAALTEWLAGYGGAEPPLAISDPMPSGFFPRPVLPTQALPGSRPSDADHDARKALDKSAWIAEEDWATCRAGLSTATLLAALARGRTAGRLPRATSEGTVIHAGIHRFTGGTAQEGGGLLFASDEVFHADHAVSYDVWVRTSMGTTSLQALFDAGLSGGYGRDGATGAGDVRLASVEEAALPALDGANAGVLLGPAVPLSGDPAAGFFNVGTRAGRLGGDFATGATPSGSTERQKRPVRCLLRGSLLVAAPPPPVVGGLVDGVHEDPAIRHYAIGLLLPCRIDAPVVQEVRS